MSRRVSERWKPGVNRWKTVVQWRDGDLEWHDAPILAGTVKCSTEQECRWQADLTLPTPDVHPDGVFVHGMDGINLTTWIRIRHGMVYGPGGDEELLDFGLYRVTAPVESRGQVQITAVSFEDYLIRARFEREKDFPAADARTTLHALIRPVLPSAQLSFRDIDPEEEIGRLEGVRDRWPLIDGNIDDASVARALGARVYHGAGGEWVVSRQPSLADPITFEARRGEVLVESPEMPQSLDGLATSIVVTGESTDGGAPRVGPVVVWDGDFRSPTYRWRKPEDGGIGSMPRFYSSPLIKSVRSARNAGVSILARSHGWTQQLAFTQLHDPSIEAGDVGLVDTPHGPQRQILDEITYDLTGKPMQATCRAVQATLTDSYESDQGESLDELA